VLAVEQLLGSVLAVEQLLAVFGGAAISPKSERSDVDNPRKVRRTRLRNDESIDNAAESNSSKPR
jgi:hypothetical protein